ncbi:MAG: hypothetical protein ACLFUJ_03460 [Phycisphaerae bacterium]
MKTATLIALIALAGLSTPSWAGEIPPLPDGPRESEPAPPPQGPDDGEIPPMPPGPGDSGGNIPALPGEAEDGPPSVPDIDPTQQVQNDSGPGWFDVTGFVEIRGGVRTQPDRHEPDASVGEARLQLSWDHRFGPIAVQLTGDLLYDEVSDHHSVDLESGQGAFDLREAHATFSPAEFMDVRVGRQILTWGTGDLIFLNDLFPKDWQSLFVGRDVEYLKAPSDAIRMGMFSEMVNFDLVYVPRFDSDRYVTGHRISYYSGTLERRAGRDAIVDADQPDEWFVDHEWHGRLYRQFGSYEVAGYGYWGYWKSPAGIDPATGEATFPRLGVWGASIRGPVSDGIGNIEAAYYDSRQDRDGDDPFVDNSQVRLLAGYEQDLPEIAEDLTVGVQYYVEMMMDYDDYRTALPPGASRKDRCRHVTTIRITKKLLQQNLTLSLFAFYSPSDSDAYLRPHAHYRIDDNWSVDFGANVFFGSRNDTFFGQFERNSNVYAALRYSF